MTKEYFLLSTWKGTPKMHYIILHHLLLKAHSLPSWILCYLQHPEIRKKKSLNAFHGHKKMAGNNICTTIVPLHHFILNEICVLHDSLLDLYKMVSFTLLCCLFVIQVNLNPMINLFLEEKFPLCINTLGLNCPSKLCKRNTLCGNYTDFQ